MYSGGGRHFCEPAFHILRVLPDVDILPAAALETINLVLKRREICVSVGVLFTKGSDSTRGGGGRGWHSGMILLLILLFFSSSSFPYPFIYQVRTPVSCSSYLSLFFFSLSFCLSSLYSCFLFLLRLFFDVLVLIFALFVLHLVFLLLLFLFFAVFVLIFFSSLYSACYSLILLLLFAVFVLIFFLFVLHLLFVPSTPPFCCLRAHLLPVCPPPDIIIIRSFYPSFFFCCLGALFSCLYSTFYSFLLRLLFFFLFSFLCALILFFKFVF